LYQAWLQDKKLGPYIDGTFKETSVEFDVFKPCTEQVIAKVGLSTAEDVNAAVNSSLKAADTWANLSGHKRACHICRWVYSVDRFWYQDWKCCMYCQLHHFYYLFIGKYLSVHHHWGHAVAQWLKHSATNWKVTGSIPDGVTGIFHCQSFWLHCGPGVDSASNRNEYQEYLVASVV
jgi:hypothetical protein